VLTLVAVLFAIFVLPSPWGLVAICTGAALDIAETFGFRWWSRRKRAQVGVETLVGQRAIAVGSLRPSGHVRIHGELWSARCDAGCDAGAAVVVRAVDGLVLVVDPL